MEHIKLLRFETKAEALAYFLGADQGFKANLESLFGDQSVDDFPHIKQWRLGFNKAAEIVSQSHKE